MLRNTVCVFLIRRVEHSIQRRSTSNCPAIETSCIFVFNLTDYGYEEPLTLRPPSIAEKRATRCHNVPLRVPVTRALEERPQRKLSAGIQIDRDSFSLIEFTTAIIA